MTKHLPRFRPNGLRTNTVSLRPMTENVNTPRPYRSANRSEQAAATRRSILEAARELFVKQGYLRTTVTRIADRTGVNVDTLYAAVGRKPAILRELVETAISGADQAIPAERRAYVQAVRAAGTATEKIALYAAAVTEMAPRTAPIFRALRDAAITDPSCSQLYAEITGRRAVSMRLFATDLRSTGSVRADLSDSEVADIVWTMNSFEYYLSLVALCGWTSARFEHHLTDAWCRLLLTRPDR